MMHHTHTLTALHRPVALVRTFSHSRLFPDTRSIGLRQLSLKIGHYFLTRNCTLHSYFLHMLTAPVSGPDWVTEMSRLMMRPR